MLRLVQQRAVFTRLSQRSFQQCLKRFQQTAAEESSTQIAQPVIKPRSNLEIWGTRAALSTVGGLIFFLLYQSELKHSYAIQQSFHIVAFEDTVLEELGDLTTLRLPRWYEFTRGRIVRGWQWTEPNLCDGSVSDTPILLPFFPLASRMSFSSQPWLTQRLVTLILLSTTMAR